MSDRPPALRILVSGGSRGLGLAFCRRYLERGHAVVTFARKLTPPLRALAAASEGRLTCFELDLLEEDAPRRAAAAAREALGAIDALVNNVAVGQDSLLAHTRDEDLAGIVTLNVTRTLQLTRHAVRAMIVAGGGAVLNVSSICAAHGYAGVTAYAASKGAIEAFTRSAARELGGHGIVVNCVAPGFFQSEMSALLAASDVERIRRRTPTGALTDVEQVVRACDPLLHARALNISGQILTVDGGATA